MSSYCPNSAIELEIPSEFVWEIELKHKVSFVRSVSDTSLHTKSRTQREICFPFLMSSWTNEVTCGVNRVSLGKASVAPSRKLKAERACSWRTGAGCARLDYESSSAIHDSHSALQCQAADVALCVEGMAGA